MKLDTLGGILFVAAAVLLAGALACFAGISYGWNQHRWQG